MPIRIELEPLELPGSAHSPLPPVDFHWEPETEILSARLREGPASRAAADTTPGDDTLELCGDDGSWLMLDVEGTHLHGVEVAVWPALGTRPGLRPPVAAAVARARVVCEASHAGGIATIVSAESDEPATTLHFRVGRAPVASTVRIGGGLLVDLDARSRLAGLWLLNVPPAPNQA